MNQKSFNEKYYQVFQNNPAGLSISRFPDGRFIDVNKAFSNIFGFESHELIGISPDELGIFKSSELESRITSIEENTFFPCSFEIKAHAKSGQKLFLFCATDMIEINSEKHIITNIIDITGKKKVEQAYISLNELLEKKVRDRTLELNNAFEKEKELNDIQSRFVSLASHEFKTPLSTILSSSYLMKQYLENLQFDSLEKHIQRIDTSAKKLNEIVNAFLEVQLLARNVIKPTYQRFNLHDLINSSIEKMKPECRNGQKIHLDYIGETFVYQDRTIIHNIIINLFSNAIKYSDENDQIECFCKSVYSNMIQITIKDSGIGIPKNEQKYLFSKFFKARNAETIDGIGLGLYIVKRYTEIIGGYIDFESEENIGTTFSFTFPSC